MRTASNSIKRTVPRTIHYAAHIEGEFTVDKKRYGIIKL